METNERELETAEMEEVAGGGLADADMSAEGLGKMDSSPKIKVCPVCGRFFKSTVALKEHIVREHS